MQNKSWKSKNSQTNTINKATETTLTNSEIDETVLRDIYNQINNTNVLAVIGGGTAALTYLYTASIDPQFETILILGNRGYWEKAAHRLAQPHHIFALPHKISDDYVDSAACDKEKGVLPHQPESAYVHSHDYQARIIELEKATIDRLISLGLKVYIVRNAWVNNISKQSFSQYKLSLKGASKSFNADKVIIATGAGPARKLETNLQQELIDSIKEEINIVDVNEKILNYTDVLTPVVQKCRNKDVLIYGGGATAAWAMEVADLIAQPVAWVGRSGFENAESAGPRVEAIINGSRSVQIHGKITSIMYLDVSPSVNKKLVIEVTLAEFGSPSKIFVVDYLFNCIGQEPYERNGLPGIISPDIKAKIIPLIDKNNVTGNDEPCMLGWATKQQDLMIIGAAQGTYYDKINNFSRGWNISSFIPRSGHDAITIGGVVSSVCAVTDYMPIKQNPVTGQIKLLSLNVHVMNATQLAVYFTGMYPYASAKQVNKAVESLVCARAETEFGLTNEDLKAFLHFHFGEMEQNLDLVEEEKIMVNESCFTDSYAKKSLKFTPRLFEINTNDTHDSVEISPKMSSKR